ncbi:MAG: hypothetical protein JOZ90_13150 [Alphaproteobacteria bacterium]|nr:hypothetical protein [Alphaproteobacteria bacterium]MBV9370323.1 hypothetical protein [Alphaproteobacteria bacterium]MBV9902020.1 hypothetical protein [Alphaproteobacteria bacterium]
MGFIERVVLRARTLAAAAAGYVLLTFFAGAFLLLLFEESGIVHLSERPLVLLTLVAAMIFFLRQDVSVSQEALERRVAGDMAAIAAQVAAVEAATARAGAAVEHGLARHAAKVELLHETLKQGGRIMSLEQALIDLKPRFDALQPDEAVEISHLGLDMSHAWEKLRPALEALCRKSQVSFRLLILGKEGEGAVPAPSPGERPALPIQVEEWLEGGDRMRRQIEARLRYIATAGGPAEGRPGGALDYEIRSYRDFPIVHGIRIHRPFEAAYFSLSRWTGDDWAEYSWGGECYHRILGPASDEQMDLMKLFDGHFGRLWETNARSAGR